MTTLRTSTASGITVILFLMKTAISIPNDLFDRAEAAARDRGWTRSQLYSHAVEKFLADEGVDPVTASYNACADALAEEALPPQGGQFIRQGQWEW